jgi:hypothetical protein
MAINTEGLYEAIAAHPRLHIHGSVESSKTSPKKRR